MYGGKGRRGGKRGKGGRRARPRQQVGGRRGAALHKRLGEEREKEGMRGRGNGKPAHRRDGATGKRPEVLAVDVAPKFSTRDGKRMSGQQTEAATAAPDREQLKTTDKWQHNIYI